LNNNQMIQKHKRVQEEEKKEELKEEQKEEIKI
jgi:hypothetical protein